MSIIKFGDRAKVTDSKINRNILVVDDISTIETTLITFGDDAEVIRVDVEGNEIHTPESYALRVKGQREKLFAELAGCQKAIEGIQDELAKQEIERGLAEAAQQELTEDGEWRFKRIISRVAQYSKEIGVAVIAGVITNYLGHDVTV